MSKVLRLESSQSEPRFTQLLEYDSVHSLSVSIKSWILLSSLIESGDALSLHSEFDADEASNH